MLVSPSSYTRLSRRLITSAACLGLAASYSFSPAWFRLPPTPRSINTSLALRMSSGASSGGSFCYRYPRPSVTVDTLIFCLEEGEVKLLLIERGNDPFKGSWALPGGFVDKDEGLDAAAARELKEETSLDNISFAQVGSYGDPGRDPRGHTVTVAYTAFLLSTKGTKAGDDASAAAFFPFGQLPPLAFDHKKIIEETWPRLVVCESRGETVVNERGSGKVLCALPDAKSAELVRNAKPYS